MKNHTTLRLQFYPVIRERLPDLARFFKGHGKFRYCSCMRWRLTSAQFKCSTKGERIVALEQFVDEGKPVGVLAYADGEPVGWCSIAPREIYEALDGAERCRASTARQYGRWSVSSSPYLRIALGAIAVGAFVSLL